MRNGSFTAIIAASAVFMCGCGEVSENKSKTVKMPDLCGMTLDDAVEEYDDLLTIKKSGDEYNESFDKGEICYQSIDEGEELEEGSKVRVKISRGKEPDKEVATAAEETKAEEMPMPDLHGLDYETACDMYEGKLKIVKAAEEYSDFVPKGAVIKQSVGTDKPVRIGEKVGVKVSLGKKNTTLTKVPLAFLDSDDGCTVYWVNTEEEGHFNGEIIDFVFKVSENAPSGEYDVKLPVIDLSDSAGKPLSPDVSCDGIIFVSTDATGTPELPEDVFFMGLDNGSAAPGEDVVLHFRIQNNPGLAGVLLQLSYDKNILECVGANAVGEFAALQ